MEDIAERRHEAMVASVAQCISARRGVYAAEGYSPTLHGVVHARRVMNARAGAPPPPVVVRSRRGDGGRRLRRVARRLARAVAGRRALLVLHAVARGHVHIRGPFVCFGWDRSRRRGGGRRQKRGTEVRRIARRGRSRQRKSGRQEGSSGEGRGFYGGGGRRGRSTTRLHTTEGEEGLRDRRSR